MIGASTTIFCKNNPNIKIKVLPGHFAMTHSHTNYYVDIMDVKTSQAEALQAATTLADIYNYQQTVDTIMCMDGSEIVGAYMAMKMSQSGIFTLNGKEDIHVITAENENSRQMIIRDNIQPMIKGKKVLILAGSVLTGKNVMRAIRCIEYYGGEVVGIAAIFSIAEKIAGLPVSHLFDTSDIPDYHACDYTECTMCKAGAKIDALANCYGYSKL